LGDWVIGKACLLLVLAAWVSACRRGAPDARAPAHALDVAAESYVRLVLALGERDADSLDSYHGPPAWQAEARTRRAALNDIRIAAVSLAASLSSAPGANGEDEVRRMFLIRQLRAVVARIDIVRGARPPFAEELRALFGLDVSPRITGVADAHETSAPSVRAAIDRLLPGTGPLGARYAAFDRRFLVAPDRLARVLSRAIDGCRAATRAHISLSPTERVDVEYAPDLAWSAFTRYQGRFTSRIQVNASLPLTVDRALDLACHEGYPGHHTIDSLLDARFGGQRIELVVRPLFSPQSLLHEAASSVAGELAFPGPARLAFERDQLFGLAGLDPSEADRYVRVGRLVDQLRGVQAHIARRYLDGELDFPRASAALERDALMPSADASLKFLNRFRTYAATYMDGRSTFSRYLDARSPRDDDGTGRWRAYINVVTDPSQVVHSEPLPK
jgi:hypothetical protein